ncbi:HAD family phosphatase [Treponema sp.]
MSIKAVVFDYGKVLSFSPEQETIGLLASIAGVEDALMEKIMYEERDIYDRGSISGLDYYKQGLSKHGVDIDEGSLAALVRSDLESWANLNPETVKLADSVKKAGLKLGILSNMPHEFLALCRKRFPLIAGADVGIYSCELGLNKPEKAIYEALLARLMLEPEEVAFFDDLEPNVRGARDLGIQAFLWKDADTARKNLLELGVQC